MNDYAFFLVPAAFIIGAIFIRFILLCRDLREQEFRSRTARVVSKDDRDRNSR